MTNNTFFISPRYNFGERAAAGRVWIFTDQTKQNLVPLWCYSDLAANTETGTGPISNPVPLDEWGIASSAIFYDYDLFRTAYYVIEDARSQSSIPNPEMVIREGFCNPSSYSDSGIGEPPSNPWGNALFGDRYWGYEIVTTSLSNLGDIGRPVFKPTSNLQGADSSGGLTLYFVPGLSSPDNVLTFQGHGGLWVARSEWINYSYLKSSLTNETNQLQDPFIWLERWNSVGPGRNLNYKNLDIDITPTLFSGASGQYQTDFRAHIRIKKTLTQGADNNQSANIKVRINTRNLDLCSLPVSISQPNNFLNLQFETEGPMTMNQMIARVSGNSVSIICGDFTAATANIPGTWSFPTSINSLNIENLIADSNPANFLQLPTAASNISFESIESEAMGGPNAQLVWANMPFYQWNHVIMTSWWYCDVDPDLPNVVVPFRCVTKAFKGNTTTDRYACRFYSSKVQALQNNKLPSTDTSGNGVNSTFQYSFVLPAVVDCPKFEHEYMDIQQTLDYSENQAWAWDNTVCPKDPECFGSQWFLHQNSRWGYITDYGTTGNTSTANATYRQSRHWTLSTDDEGMIDLSKIHPNFTRLSYDNESTPSTPTAVGSQLTTLIGYRRSPNKWKLWNPSAWAPTYTVSQDQNNRNVLRLGNPVIYLDCPNATIEGDGSTVVRGARAKKISRCIVILDRWETHAFLTAKGMPTGTATVWQTGIGQFNASTGTCNVFNFIKNCDFEDCVIIFTLDSYKPQEQNPTARTEIERSRFIFKNCDFENCVILNGFTSLDFEDCRGHDLLFSSERAARVLSGFNTASIIWHNIVNIHNDCIFKNCLVDSEIINIYGSDNGTSVTNIDIDFENRDSRPSDDSQHSVFSFCHPLIENGYKLANPVSYFTATSNNVNNVRVYSNKSRWTRTPNMMKGLGWIYPSYTYTAPNQLPSDISARTYRTYNFVKGHIDADGYFTQGMGFPISGAPFAMLPVVANTNSDFTGDPVQGTVTKPSITYIAGNSGPGVKANTIVCMPVISDALSYVGSSIKNTNGIGDTIMFGSNFDWLIYYNRGDGVNQGVANLVQVTNIQYSSNYYYIFGNCDDEGFIGSSQRTRW